MTTSTMYSSFARSEAHGNSSVYETLAYGVSGDPELLQLLDSLPGPKRQPNLLFAAVRYLDGPVAPFPEFRAWVSRHWELVRATMLLRRTQTNEPGRQACLLPLLAQIPGPLALLEVGASAGLCLYPDRWSYDYSGVHIGDATLPTLSCVVNARTPIPSAIPEVCWRAGLDLNPLDIADDDDVRWLECLVWPGQEERLSSLRTAVSIARLEPALLVKGDLATDLAGLAAQAPADATLVVFHSAVLVYVPVELRQPFVNLVKALPGHWISNEGAGAVPGVPTPEEYGEPRAQFVLALDGVPVAWASPHGQRLDWLS